MLDEKWKLRLCLLHSEADPNDDQANPLKNWKLCQKSCVIKLVLGVNKFVLLQLLGHLSIFLVFILFWTNESVYLKKV